MSAHFDEQKLMERMDEDVEFLEDMVALFERDAPTLLEEIHRAAAARDAEAMMRPAHTLKGMLGNLAAGPASAAARAVEEMARENELAEVDVSLQVLQRETEQLTDALHKFVQASKQSAPIDENKST